MRYELRERYRAFRMPTCRVALAAILLVLPLQACRTPKFLCFSSGGLGDIAINSSPDSNHGRPIAVDLVFVTDKQVWQSLSRLKARDYFATREQIRRDFPKGYLARSWELQAGQYVPATETRAPCNLVGTLIFADFASEGDHRLSLRKAKAGTVVLGADAFSWFAKGGK